ncbi:MAG TPA: hypothetical protein VNZ49_07645 [Bacteroidia bacterium]|jgi:hypothetical protein|nr:hypothetical protein [Bacteroidia bacterium]
MILKNTYGTTAVFSERVFKSSRFNTFTGSSLGRKKSPKKELKPKPVEDSESPPVEKEKKDRSMSGRTKSKIRQKLFSLSRLCKRLTLLTLTFVNKVEDEKAVIILRKFLDNVKKRSKDFQYLWVAERQTKNTVFTDNIHFHLITNKYWDIKKYWNYWIDLQNKNGVLPRDENFKASSSLDVKGLVSNNIKGISSYLTKYVTKNKDTFKCQVWNCSKKISALYTGFYSDYSFLENIKNTGIETKEIPLEHCNLHLIPIDKNTIRFYDRITVKNQTIWKLK